MSFWGELKRRNVFKVGAAYLIVAWIILQVASIVFPVLSLPGWALTLVMVILIIGLPLALIFTWAFELTADGVKRTEQVPPEESGTQVAGRKPHNLVPELDMEASRKTIAVLPFNDLSKEKDQEYFADGLSEELINKLSQVKDLQVTARTSSFHFKGKNTDIRTIGETLCVTYLLEGSVRKSENQLRVTAQLIKAVDGYHLFSETYDHELKDIFSIQDNIAKAVTTALNVTLGTGEFRRPGMTRNIRAYDKFLRASADFYKLTPGSMLAAIDQFEKALEIDPDFGLGWFLLTVSYRTCIIALPPGQTAGFKAKAEKTWKSAQIIAPDMPELLFLTAMKHQENDNWLEAERIYKQALEKKGNANLNANWAYGWMLMCTGRNSDALMYLQRAKRPNPLDPLISSYLSMGLLNSKRTDEALVEAGRFHKMEGRTISNVEFIAALETNEMSRSATIIDAKYSPEGDNPDATMLRLSKILLMEESEAALSELRELSKKTDVSPINKMALVSVASVLGDPELALEIFLKSERKDVPLLIWHPINRGIRQLPAFKTWIRQKGLYDYWRASGKWGDFCRPVGDDDFECG